MAGFFDDIPMVEDAQAPVANGWKTSIEPSPAANSWTAWPAPQASSAPPPAQPSSQAGLPEGYPQFKPTDFSAKPAPQEPPSIAHRIYDAVSPYIPDHLKDYARESALSLYEGARNRGEDIARDAGAPTVKGLSGAASTALSLPLRGVTNGEAGFGSAVDALMNPLVNPGRAAYAAATGKPYEPWGTKAEEHYNPLEQRFAYENEGLMKTPYAMMEGSISHPQGMGHIADVGNPRLSTPEEIAAFRQQAFEANPASKFTEGARAPDAIKNQDRLLEDRSGRPEPREAQPEAPQPKPSPARGFFDDIPDERQSSTGSALDTPGLPAAGQRLQLKLDEVSTQDRPFYNITRGGETVGTIDGRIYPNDPKTLFIKDISGEWDHLGPNSIGPAEVRGLLAQIRENHPEIERIAGDRSTGARRTEDHQASYVSMPLARLPESQGKSVAPEEQQSAAQVPSPQGQAYALSGFHHGPEQAVSSFPQEKATPEQWRKVIEGRPGWKDYVETTGLDDFLAGKKSITKSELLDYMRAHSADLDEKILGDPNSIDLDAVAKNAGYGTPQNMAEQRGMSLDELRRETFENFGAANPTKFEAHKIPGGIPGSYRELLIRDKGLEGREYTPEEQRRVNELQDQLGRLPLVQKDSEAKAREIHQELSEIRKRLYAKYTSKHFNDQEIAHIRFDDRTLPDGGKALFIHELQSDLHQRGRTEGYADDRTSSAYSKTMQLRVEMERMLDDLQKQQDEARAAGDARRANELEDQLSQEHTRYAHILDRTSNPKVPNAPFKGDLWMELGLKRALRYAVENGYDAIALPRSDQIAKAVGADPESLKLQYDSKMPKFLDKYTKKWGAKVERADIGVPKSADYKVGDSVQELIDDHDGDIDQALASLESTPHAYARSVAQLDALREGLRKAKDQSLEKTGPNEGNPILRITPQMRESILDTGQAYGVSGESDSGVDPRYIKQKIRGDLESGRGHAVDPQVVAQNHAIIRSHAQEIPQGVTVGAPVSVQSFPKPYDGWVQFTFRAPDGKEHTVDVPKNDLFGNRAIWIPSDRAISIFDFGEAIGADPEGGVETLGGRIRHELVHALRDSGSFTDGEWDALVGHANDRLRMLDRSGRDFFRIIGDPNWHNVPENKTLRDFYNITYAKKPESSKAELFDQEAVAHMVEVYHAFINDPVASRDLSAFGDAKPILDKMFSGEIAQRAPHNEEPSKQAAALSSGEGYKPVTETPEFKNWFGKSAVVDTDGKPMVVYHATDVPEDFSEFKTGRDGFGIHFGTMKSANERLAHLAEDDNSGGTAPYRIMPTYLSIKNPIRLTDEVFWHPEKVAREIKRIDPSVDIPEKKYLGEPFYKPKDIVSALKRAGYDGIVYKNEIEDRGSTSYIAFDSNQAKSAIGNRGTFSTSDPRISYALSGERDPEGPSWPLWQGFRSKSYDKLASKLDETYRQDRLPQGILDIGFKDMAVEEMIELRNEASKVITLLSRFPKGSQSYAYAYRKLKELETNPLYETVMSTSSDDLRRIHDKVRQEWSEKYNHGKMASEETHHASGGAVRQKEKKEIKTFNSPHVQKIINKYTRPRPVKTCR